MRVDDAAHAGRHADVEAVDQIRHRQCRLQLARDVVDHAELVHFRQHDDELVAAVAACGVGVTRGGEEPGRHQAQHAVADVVAEAVVDALEIVEVEQDQRYRAVVARGLRQRLAETILQQAAIGQPGELVVAGQAARLRRMPEVECRGERLPAEVVKLPFWTKGTAKKGK